MVESTTEIKTLIPHLEIIQNECYATVGDYHYNINKIMGQGTFSRVYQATRLSTGKLAALKVFTKHGTMAKPNKETFLQEVQIMKNLGKCPNIVEFYDEFQTENDYFIAMEYCAGETLKKFIVFNGKEGISHKTIYNFLLQMSNAFSSLQKKNKIIVHRDLKPSNILLKEANQGSPTFVITDFGIATEEIKPLQADSQPGTELYCAPEILFRGKQASNSDLWSLGIILYEMITGGTHPFIKNQNMKKEERLEEVAKCKFLIPSDIPEYLIILLKRLLILDPKKRMQWTEFFKLFSGNLYEEPTPPSVLLLNNFEILQLDSDSSVLNNEFHEITSLKENKKISTEVSSITQTRHYLFDSSHELSIYNLEKQKLKIHSHKIPFMKGRGVVGIGDKIYFIGGMAETQEKFMCYNTTYEYDIKTKKLFQLPNSSKKKAFMGITAMVNCIYSLGGRTVNSSVAKCEKYDIQFSQWESIRSLSQKKYGVAATNDHKKSVFAFGGCFANQCSNCMEQYHCEEDQWEELNLRNNSLIQVKFAAAIFIKEKILIFGGKDENRNEQNMSGIINLKTMEVIPTQTVPKSSIFYYNSPIQVKRKVYVLNAEYLLIYYVKKKHWKVQQIQASK